MPEQQYLDYRDVVSHDSMRRKLQMNHQDQSDGEHTRVSRGNSQNKIFKGKMTKMRDHINLLKFKTSGSGS